MSRSAVCQSKKRTRLTQRYQLINDNVLEWSVALIVLNPDSLYYGGYFKAKLTFPKNYPYSPPGGYHFPALSAQRYRASPD